MDVSKLIDSCIDKTLDYNIALVVFNLLKHKFRYNGTNKKWQYYENNTNIWINDKKNSKLINDIQHYISNFFIERICFLNNNNNDNNDNELKASKLIICANQLKNKKYILTIIKEARSLFEYNE